MVDGLFECYTVENALLAIPADTYAIELYNSPMHGPDTPQLKDVPGRSNIQIHAANFPHQLLGCIAPGTSHGPDYVENSKLACAALLPKIRSAIRSGQPVDICINS
jgi:hypothetical protein